MEEKYTISRESLIKLLEENPTCENINILLVEDEEESEKLHLIKLESMGLITTKYEEGKAPSFNGKGEPINKEEDIAGHDTLNLFCKKRTLRLGCNMGEKAVNINELKIDIEALRGNSVRPVPTSAFSPINKTMDMTRDEFLVEAVLNMNKGNSGYINERVTDALKQYEELLSIGVNLTNRGVIMNIEINKSGEIIVTKKVVLNEILDEVDMIKLISKILSNKGRYGGEQFHDRWTALYNVFDLIYGTDIRSEHQEYIKENFGATKIEYIIKTKRLNDLIYIVSKLYKKEFEKFVGELL